MNGDFDQVLSHIRTLNQYKAKYKAQYPKLNWQFVIFGHNEHEVERVRAQAATLNMTFSTKLSWEDLYHEPFSPVIDKNQVRRSIASGVADRDEYRRKHGKDYVAECCAGMWSNIKINHDDRVLGCSVNYWGDYGNAFTEGLEQTAYGAQIQYARDMLAGRRPPKAGIPCTTCKVYENIRDHKVGRHDLGQHLPVFR